jgi:para-nitrobenzyl esterase
MRSIITAVLALIALGVAGLLAFEVAATVDGPTIQVSSGAVRGTRESDLNVFRGIPYAAPPTGALRWRPPQPSAAWAGVRAVQEYAPVCPQRFTAGEFSLPARPMSEDCLTLNVWTPDVRADAKLPVMVWIHGGAFRLGAGGIPLYDGSALARRNVVVVTFNYRLGLFGVFGHPALAAEQAKEPRTNYAFLDQVAALEWVRDNIARFGGDPRRVTIFGESAGGVSVLLHMISPRSRGLFAQAIAQSGGGWTRQQSVADADALGERAASALGLANADMAALRAVPAEQVVDAFAKIAPPLGFGPVVDGDVIPETTPDAFLAGRFAAVPLIIGANTYEQSLLRATGDPRALLAAIPPEILDQARTLYGADVKNDEDLAGVLFRDGGFTGPARWIAQRNAEKAPAFVYRYAHIRVARRGEVPGAGHGAEVPFLFDSLSAISPVARLAWRDEDYAMARIVGDCWVAFARTGIPYCGNTRWPTVSDAPRNVMMLENAPSLVKDPWADRLDFHQRVFLKRVGAAP